MADIPQLVTLLEELFILEADFQVDQEKQVTGLALLIASQKDAVFVAEVNNAVIGMCSVPS